MDIQSPDYAAVGLVDLPEALQLDQRKRERVPVSPVLGDQPVQRAIEVGAPGNHGRLIRAPRAGLVGLADLAVGDRRVQRSEDLGQPARGAHHVAGRAQRGRAVERGDQERLQRRQIALDLGRGAGCRAWRARARAPAG